MYGMVNKAVESGYEYIGISDHTKTLGVAKGLSEKELLKQFKEIDALNKKLKGFKVLKGSEVDIKPDGSLDFDDNVLKQLDVVIAAVHSKFGMDKNIIRVRQPGIVENNLDAPLMRLADILKKAAAVTADDEIKYELKGYSARLAGVKKGIEIFLKEKGNFHMWLEDDAIVFDPEMKKWPQIIPEVGVYWNWNFINVRDSVTTRQFDERMLRIMEKEKWNI